MGSTSRLSLFLISTVGVGSVSGAALSARPVDTAKPGAAASLDFTRDVRPILAAHCFSCHGPENQEGGLRLDQPAGVLRGGKAGPLFVAGKSGASELIRRVTSRDPSKIMPLGAPPLAPKQIAILRQWIDLGASLPGGRGPGAGDTLQSTSKQSTSKVHWSFVPPQRLAVPKVKNAAWVRNPVDAFVLAGLEKKGLSPSPPADRLTLLRRVTLDLTGLPPTLAEIQTFQADRAPGAYEKVVRRLLDSPRYGERWAQHWLDVVRFAETHGFEGDGDRPQAWRFRDYVVQSLNQDKPYDRFLQEQVAGDEIDPHSFELRVATGFLRTGPQHVVGGNVDLVEQRQEWLTEAVAGVGSSVMGITIGCARCHDHKFDPIPQQDFYRLQAFFAGTANQNFQPAAPDAEKAYREGMQVLQERLRPIQAEIGGIERPYREKLRQQKLEALEPPYRQALDTPDQDRTAAQKRLASEAGVMLKIAWDEVLDALTPADREGRAALRQRLHALELEAPAPVPMAPGVAESLSPVPPVHVLIRGDVHAKGPQVEAGFPIALSGALPAAVKPAAVKPAAAQPEAPGRRTQLAHWLTRPDHPLTGRVLVNRVWQHHFGRGLVATPNDFGRHGEKPSHPELLDWLASVFTTTPTSSTAQGGSGSPEGARFGITQGSKGAGSKEEGTRGTVVTTGFQGSAASFTVHRSSFQPSSTLRHPPTSTPGLGWSLKALHYLLVTSNAYRQASAVDARKAKADPDNRLLWRQNRRRLDAEAIRDSVLQAAGTLNGEIGGPAIRVPLEPEVYAQIFTEGEPDNLWPVTPDARQHLRRSLYLLRKRNVRLPMLAVFDAPDMMSSCGARGQSVHALQALTLLNSDFMGSQSQALARRLLQESPADTRGRIHRLYLETLGRPPQPRELAATERFLAGQVALVRERLARGEAVARLQGLAGRDPAEVAAWIDLSLAVLNLNEFVYVK